VKKELRPLPTEPDSGDADPKSATVSCLQRNSGRRNSFAQISL